MYIQDFINIKNMKEQLNAFAVCHNTCFQRTRQIINLLKLAISNKNNENNDIFFIINNNYNNNSNKITIMRGRIEVFFFGFRQFSAYFCHPMYFSLSSNRIQVLSSDSVSLTSASMSLEFYMQPNQTPRLQNSRI